jgi:hypothetical protein
MPAFDLFDKRPDRNQVQFRQKIMPEKSYEKREINLKTEDIFKS